LPHVRATAWYGTPTGLDRFLHLSTIAIATYIHQREHQSRFDRASAKTVLLEAVAAMGVAERRLQKISEWHELSNYLERLFGAIRTRQSPSEGGIDEKFTTDESLQLAMQRFEDDYNAYRQQSPDAIVLQLLRLEPVLSLAAERVEFQAGDFQRDFIAQQFADEMTFAWGAATGKLATYAKPSPRSRKPSPFALLLTAINQEFFEAPMRSRNNFRDHAAAAIKKMKARLADPGTS
jgi:hypothetical protein